MLPGPRDALGAAQCEQQAELLGEQLVVVVEVVAEERERLDERATAGHDLRSPVREQVDRRELLKDAHGIVGAEDADRARQTDPGRPRRDGGEGHSRRGDDEVRPVVLADAEDVEAHLLRKLGFLQQLSHALGRAGVAELRECVGADLHRGAKCHPNRYCPGSRADYGAIHG